MSQWVLQMKCYFLRGGRVVGVGMLAAGLSDQDSIARAHKLAAKRKGPIDSFEVWDGARLVIRHSAPRADGAATEAAVFGQALP
jgi:hypothetical protein